MSDKFDYEEARLDIIDSGCDPDYLDERNPAKRDKYMRDCGLDPKWYGSTYEPSDSSSSSSSKDDSCYLTTACIVAKNLPDDCAELQTLRNFRDNYLKNLPEGEAEIAEYYATAPLIVKKVNLLPDANLIWTKLYSELVEPCVKMIHEGKLEETHRLYRTTALRMQAEYL